MSLLFQSGAERRDSAVPPIPNNSERGSFGTRKLNLSSTESSLQKIAIYASVRLLREVVNMMPLDFFTGTGDSKRQINPPRWLEDPGGDGYGLPDWASMVTYCDAMRGNVVGRILHRDNNYRPDQIALQHPDDVSVWRNEKGEVEWYLRGERVPKEEVWHRRSFSIPGAVWGLSPIGAHALTIGLGISAEQFGAQYFLDGGHPTALFQNTEKKLDPDSTKTIKERIRSVLSGNREPLVLGSDWNYTPIQVTPNDSQFLETNNYTSSECARIFGPGMPAVLGYEVGGSLTYATIEQFNQQLLTFTLDPWLVRLERMVYDLLPRPQFVRFNRGALLRTDLLSRYRAHEIAIRNEFTTVNRVLDIEDQPHLPWGDERPTTKTAPALPVQMES